jgi:mannose-6-phosphate isomerase-like protein (cupin superfamily)
MTGSTPELGSTYAQLHADGTVRCHVVDAEFWPRLAAGASPEVESGRLVMQFDFTQDWPTWERHPAGDEVVVLVAGAATLVLAAPEGRIRVSLQAPGEFVVVPAGQWHTAHVPSRARMLFITPGRGTQNQPTEGFEPG